MPHQDQISQLQTQVDALEAELSGLESALDTEILPPASESERLQHKFLATGERILETRRRLLTQLIAECYQEQQSLDVTRRAFLKRCR